MIRMRPSIDSGIQQWRSLLAAFAFFSLFSTPLPFLGPFLLHKIKTGHKGYPFSVNLMQDQGNQKSTGEARHDTTIAGPSPVEALSNV